MSANLNWPLRNCLRRVRFRNWETIVFAIQRFLKGIRYVKGIRLLGCPLIRDFTH